MAERGKLIPVAQRIDIRQRVACGESQRQVAKQLGLARETVRKYSRPK